MGVWGMEKVRRANRKRIRVAGLKRGCGGDDNLNKHSERLAEGKLLAKWHTPPQIEENIGKERAKLGELQATPQA